MASWARFPERPELDIGSGYDSAVSHSHEHHRPLDSKDGWNERYLADRGENIWSGNPNGSLIVEVGTMEPGRAIDLGCGEGADAIWLGTRGWDVTGIDISNVALSRAETAAKTAGASIDWVCADFVAVPPEAAAFDLVTTHYPALLQAKRAESIAALTIGVRPGGTLLFVAHHVTDVDAVREHGFDPDDYLTAEDVASALDDGWRIVTMETRERLGGSSERSAHTSDVVLRAIRT